ncbi:alpha/beta hydrolase [Novosphingobium sp. KA1]|uniref:alpha/beta hydrolase n=1 Tax=Novosphingobium sp. (strain KA1) TaxID=164608 RepID=UPI001A8EE1FB|nr:alpha/beta hydrolase-fold protein [Novosphingobium sp. KA1]
MAAPGLAAPGSANIGPQGPAVTVPGSTQWDMTSADGQRHYRVMMAVPPGPAPAEGWPVIYVLDGNAFFATTVEAVRLEAFLARYQPAVVVGIGYDTDQPIDIVSRNFDYTPPTGPAPEYDESNPQRLAGGAESFVAFIEQQLKPAVAARAAIDPRRQALFGHSYGGLFAAYVYLRHPGLFDHVAAASASLWYRHFHLPALAAAGPPAGGHKGSLLLMAGENEQVPSAEEVAMLGPDRIKALAALKQVDNARALAATLKAQGADARFHMFEGETHASVVPAAISRAVRFVLRPPEGAPVPPASASASKEK